MKGLWSSILGKWKETAEGKKFGTVPKKVFPVLLKCLVDQLAPTVTTDLISGFRSCGIYPKDLDALLEKFIPTRPS